MKRGRMIGWLAGLVIATASVPVVVNPTAAHAGPSWVEINSSCITGGVSGWSTWLRCWSKKQLQNDGNGTYDYYAFRMTISGNSTNGAYMGKLWVEPYPGPGSDPMVLTGSDPISPDHTQNSQPQCEDKTWTLGLTLEGTFLISYSSTSHECKYESAGPKLYSDTNQGHLAGIWSAPQGHRAPSGSVRKIFAAMDVRVAQGKFPTWKTDRMGADAYSGQ